MTARQRLTDALHTAGSKLDENGGQSACCPAHDDRNASLTIGTRNDGNGVLVNCHAGCTADAIVAALGLRLSDLYDEPQTNGSKPVIVATYDYVDETGTLLWQKLRYVPKRFVQRRPDGRGGWIWKQVLAGIDRPLVLYRLPELLASDGPVYLPEGEKCADALARAGVTATTWTEGAWQPGNSPKWKPEYTKLLTGRDVVIVRDRDEAGEHTAATIADLLDGAAASVRIVQAAEGNDAADHLAAGHTVAELTNVEVPPSSAPREVASPPEDPYPHEDAYSPPEEDTPRESPIPLAPPVNILPFPVDAFPTAVADMVGAVAEATQTDPAMAATSALTVLAAAACGRAEIEARDGWIEPLSLFTATVARPGERKSAVQEALNRPLREAEAQIAEGIADTRRDALVKARIATQEADKAEGNVVKGKGSLTAALDARKVADDAEAAVPVLPRLFADDATQEALTTLMAEQGGRMAVLSAEGGIFDIIAGRYTSGIPSLDVYLKGHAGDDLRIDRKGRPAEHIERAALTIGVMIQPTVLATIGAHKQFRGLGLLARFLYCRPCSLVGHRRADPEPVPQSVRQAYHARVGGLAANLAQHTERLTLHLDGPARQLLVNTLEHIEPQLGDGGELASLADWGSKLAGAILRIAALIHLAEHGVSDVTVTRDTLERAIKIGGYFRAQAIASFAEMRMDPDTADAIYLLDKIRGHHDDVISRREMRKRARKFHTNDELEPALSRLVDHGWLTPAESERTGGRRSEKYRIHYEIDS